LQAKNSRTQ